MPAGQTKQGEQMGGLLQGLEGIGGQLRGVIEQLQAVLDQIEGAQGGGNQDKRGQGHDE